MILRNIEAIIFMLLKIINWTKQPNLRSCTIFLMGKENDFLVRRTKTDAVNSVKLVKLCKTSKIALISRIRYESTCEAYNVIFDAHGKNRHSGGSGLIA